MIREFKAGDLVRFRGMPGLGVGVFKRYTEVDAYSGRPFRCRVELDGLDEGKPYKYEDSFAVSELVALS
jgi:hypothetical protein